MQFPDTEDHERSIFNLFSGNVVSLEYIIIYEIVGVMKFLSRRHPMKRSRWEKLNPNSKRKVFRGRRKVLATRILLLFGENSFERVEKEESFPRKPQHNYFIPSLHYIKLLLLVGLHCCFVDGIYTVYPTSILIVFVRDILRMTGGNRWMEVCS